MFVSVSSWIIITLNSVLSLVLFEKLKEKGYLRKDKEEEKDEGKLGDKED